MQAQPGFPALAKVNHVGIITSGTIKKRTNRNKNAIIKITNSKSFFISIIQKTVLFYEILNLEPKFLNIINLDK